MKKVYLFSLSLFAAGVLSAQTETETKTVEQKLYNGPITAPENRPQMFASDRAADDIIWSDDFSTAADWTAAGPSADYNLTGWTIGNTLNSPWMTSFQSGDMGTTGDFARLAAENPASVTSGPFTLTFNNTIDLTGVPAPHLEFEQYGARFITVQAVDISTDGGTTWTQVMNNDDIEPLTLGGGSAYGQPETRRFNIATAVAANPANVMIRLFWDGAQNGANMNYVDYGWYVDDIRIVEGHGYESELVTPIYRMGVGMTYDQGLDYHLIPLSQSSEIEFSGKILNNGGNVQTGSNLSVDVTGAGTFNDVSPSIDIAVGAVDTFVVATGFTPAATGVYNFTMMANQTNTDALLTNNEFTGSFEVTDYTFGRDNDVELGSITNISGNTGLDMSLGNVMNVFANGTVGALDIKITDNSDNFGKTMYGAVYKLNAAQDGYDWVGQTEDYEIKLLDVGTFVHLVLEDVVNVTAGEEILIVAGHQGDDVEFATAQTVEDGTVLGYYQGGGSLFSLTNASAVMIRADMRDFTTINEEAVENITVSQNVPNPFNGNTVITYNLNEASNVSVQVIDVTGKVVNTINEGTQVSGEHTMTIDGTSLAEGTYFYTFTAGEYSVTKRMVVSK